MTRHARLSLLFLLFLCLGCGGIGARRRFRATDLFASWKASLGGDKLSARTLQTLRAWDLEKLYEDQPKQALERLQQVTDREPSPDLVFACSELSFHIGEKTECKTCSEALNYYYFCAGYAYHYLFSIANDGSFELRNSPFDPRFRAACDLYNASVTRCLRAAQKSHRLDIQHSIHIPCCDRKRVNISTVFRGFAWKPKDFGKLLFCEDYETKGLANHYRTYGLGVPLIAERPESARQKGDRYPGKVSFPVTAFFRFTGSLKDLHASRVGTLELYNPLAVQAI